MRFPLTAGCWVLPSRAPQTPACCSAPWPHYIRAATWRQGFERRLANQRGTKPASASRRPYRGASGIFLHAADWGGLDDPQLPPHGASQSRLRRATESSRCVLNGNWSKHPNGAARLALAKRILEKLQSQPGVVSAAASNDFPMDQTVAANAASQTFEIEGQAKDSASHYASAGDHTHGQHGLLHHVGHTHAALRPDFQRLRPDGTSGRTRGC